MSLVINMGGIYKVTHSPILAEEFRRKVRNKLFPRTQIPTGFSNSSESVSSPYVDTHIPKITLHQTEQIFFLLSLYYLSSHFTHCLLTIIDYCLQEFAMYLPMNPVLSSAQIPIISMTFQIMKY